MRGFICSNYCGLLPLKIWRKRPERIEVTKLIAEPSAHRGQAVRLAGTVLRVSRFQAPENAFGVEAYHELWLADEQRRLVAVYVLDLPHGFPLGERVNERVECLALFFKRWAHISTDGIRTTPLFAAEGLGWLPEKVASLQQSPTPQPLVVTAVAAALAAFLVWFIASRIKREHPGRRHPPRKLYIPQVGEDVGRGVLDLDASAAPSSDDK